MTNLSKLILIYIACVAVYGCKPKVEEIDLASKSIAGIWALKNGCVPSASSGYVRNTVGFDTNGVYAQESKLYSNSGCSNLIITQTLTGTYSSSGGAGAIDTTLGTWTVTPASSAVASSYNSSSLCGYTNWANGVPQSILGRTCGSDTMPSAGEVEYSIINIKDYDMPAIPPYIPASMAGDMTLGTSTSGHDGTTPSQRHNTTNGNYVYRRQ